jgi:hypothetical protein
VSKQGRTLPALGPNDFFYCIISAFSQPFRLLDPPKPQASEMDADAAYPALAAAATTTGQVDQAAATPTTLV